MACLVYIIFRGFFISQENKLLYQGCNKGKWSCICFLFQYSCGNIFNTYSYIYASISLSPQTGSLIVTGRLYKRSIIELFYSEKRQRYFHFSRATELENAFKEISVSKYWILNSIKNKFLSFSHLHRLYMFYQEKVQIENKTFLIQQK